MFCANIWQWTLKLWFNIDATIYSSKLSKKQNFSRILFINELKWGIQGLLVRKFEILSVLSLKITIFVWKTRAKNSMASRNRTTSSLQHPSRLLMIHSKRNTLPSAYHNFARLNFESLTVSHESINYVDRERQTFSHIIPRLFRNPLPAPPIGIHIQITENDTSAHREKQIFPKKKIATRY